MWKQAARTHNPKLCCSTACRKPSVLRRRAEEGHIKSVIVRPIYHTLLLPTLGERSPHLDCCFGAHGDDGIPVPWRKESRFLVERAGAWAACLVQLLRFDQLSRLSSREAGSSWGWTPSTRLSREPTINTVQMQSSTVSSASSKTGRAELWWAYRRAGQIRNAPFSLSDVSMPSTRRDTSLKTHAEWLFYRCLLIGNCLRSGEHPNALS